MSKLFQFTSLTFLSVCEAGKDAKVLQVIIVGMPMAKTLNAIRFSGTINRYNFVF